jgi:ribosome assembly protein RRB1
MQPQQHMFYSAAFEWFCCRSFDLVKDELGGPRATFPHCLMLVAGTQASSAKQNYIAFLKLANLGQGR